MMNKKPFASILVTIALIASVRAADPQVTAHQVAEWVWTHSGGEHWAKVRTIRFTFNVSQGDKVVVSASHNWNVRNGTDTVSWNGKTVTVNVWNPGDDADATAAYKRWTNDSYWLLAPLKLLDQGCHLDDMGMQEIDGKKYHVLHCSFGPVGMTSHDRYNVYVDPLTYFVRRWDYMPTPDKKISGTWESYKEFGGLFLSTEHQFGDNRVWFSDIAVETD